VRPSSIISYINGVEKHRESNFTTWRDQINLISVIMDKDHSMREKTPIAPEDIVDNDTTLLSALLAMRNKWSDGSVLTGWPS